MRLNLITKINASFALVLLVLSLMGGGLLAVAATAAALLLINREIRERSQAERELQTAKERLDSILTSLDDVVWSLSPKTYELLYLNPAAEQLYAAILILTPIGTIYCDFMENDHNRLTKSSQN
jgi:PAS domain-containing protein